MGLLSRYIVDDESTQIGILTTIKDDKLSVPTSQIGKLLDITPSRNKETKEVTFTK